MPLWLCKVANVFGFHLDQLCSGLELYRRVSLWVAAMIRYLFWKVETSFKMTSEYLILEYFNLMRSKVLAL